ncbi:sensor histidine kinase [Bacillus sp. EB01]|uniref:sensor histidine kinase n=1 Tax=Bacillus sp. EB01 TaxID=1347086 RepID=UPI00069483BA|nr:HAMP domain-containing sensor histidine kinase [Bacillus sp. EB01]
MAKTELERAERIITDYLTFAKPASDKLEVLDVSKEMLHILELIHPFANMNSVIINIDLRNEVKVKGERHLFHQCILNIVKNAIEAMEENGGTLTVMTQGKGENSEIYISDTGIGMNSEQIERLGEPYFSLKGKNGTGLGMMVVYSIINSMNGKVFIESKPGQGTTFVLHFPIPILEK